MKITIRILMAAVVGVVLAWASMALGQSVQSVLEYAPGQSVWEYAPSSGFKGFKGEPKIWEGEPIIKEFVGEHRGFAGDEFYIELFHGQKPVGSWGGNNMVIDFGSWGGNNVVPDLSPGTYSAGAKCCTLCCRWDGSGGKTCGICCYPC